MDKILQCYPCTCQHMHIHVKTEIIITGSNLQCNYQCRRNILLFSYIDASVYVHVHVDQVQDYNKDRLYLVIICYYLRKEGRRDGGGGGLFE